MSTKTAFDPVVSVCSDLTDMTRKARDCILDIISQTPAGEQVSLALSGGSTPRKLYESLHEHDLGLLRDSKRVVFFMGDDRLCPLDDERSNFHMATQALLRDVPSDCVVPVDVTAALASAEDAANGEAGARAVAKKYEEEVLSRLPSTMADDDVKVPVADIVLLGFGSDGHTASVFPDSIAAADNSSAFSVSFPSPTMNPKVWRVTMTPVAICHARHVIILASGKDKKWVVDGILAEEAPPQDTCPVARFLRGSKGKVHFIVDGPCAGTAPSE